MLEFVLAVDGAWRGEVSVLSGIAGLMKVELEGVLDSMIASGSVKLADCGTP